MIYQIITHWQTKATVTQLCRVFGVSRSGYYAAKTKEANKEKKEKASQLCATTVRLKAEFAISGSSYGSRRLVTALRAKNIDIGRHKVRRLMREAHMKCIWKKKLSNTTDSRHDLPIAGNILNRQFNPIKPNRAWALDITYIRTTTTHGLVVFSRCYGFILTKNHRLGNGIQYASAIGLSCIMHGNGNT